MTLAPLALVAAASFAQSPTIAALAHFPPGSPSTYEFPPGSTAAAEYSKCTGATDPVSGREFAVASASNGILFVDAIPPAYANDNLSNVQLDSWFFADSPSSRWRGCASFRDYVYTVSFFHAGIRRFHIDPSQPTRDLWINDLGYDPTTMTQIGAAGPRTTVDRDHGLLYIVALDPAGITAHVFVYQICDMTTMTMIDPPQLLADWAPGGLVFDVCLHGDRAYLSYQKPNSPNWWRIIDVSGLWTNPPPTPTSWNPPWVEFQNNYWTGITTELSHDSYISPDGTTWFTNDEGNLNDGHMLARDLGTTPIPLTNSQIPELPVVGGYNQVWYQPFPEPMHLLRGLGNTGFIAHWTAGLHVIDLSTRPGAGNEYPLVASYDTSTMPPSPSIGAGAWDTYPFQDSGFTYVNDSEEGLYLLRVDQGQVNRYGPGTSNGVSVPRIEGNLRPPRIGQSYEFDVKGMQPNTFAALAFAFGEDPSYLAGQPIQALGATVLVDLSYGLSIMFSADAQGTFTLGATIPNLPNFVGAKLFVQEFEQVGPAQLACSRGTWFGIAQ